MDLPFIAGKWWTPSRWMSLIVVTDQPRWCEFLLVFLITYAHYCLWNHHVIPIYIIAHLLDIIFIMSNMSYHRYTYNLLLYLYIIIVTYQTTSSWGRYTGCSPFQLLVATRLLSRRSRPTPKMSLGGRGTQRHAGTRSWDLTRGQWCLPWTPKTLRKVSL